MKQQIRRWQLGLFAVGSTAWLSVVLAASAETHLSDWSDLDLFIASEYSALAASAPYYPPDEKGYKITYPPLSFDPTAFSALTNAIQPQLLMDIPVWYLHIVETQSASRVWITYADNMPIHTSTVPTYDPEAWARAAYGDPPEWLNGEDLKRWYSERARERFEIKLTLISGEHFAEYLQSLQASITNGPTHAAGPTPPADTNRVAFARVGSSTLGTFDFDLYTPDDLPVDIFTKTNLRDGPRWSYTGTVQAVAPFTPASIAKGYPQRFLRATRGDIDSDGDGIPDGLELLHFGTNPLLWDSSGDGLSDWRKIYQYGLDPLSRDSDGDGYSDDEELLAGTDPTQITPGATAGALRYYRDLDDRITTVYAGADGAATTATVTPVGNPTTLQERSTP